MQSQAKHMEAVRCRQERTDGKKNSQRPDRVAQDLMRAAGLELDDGKTAGHFPGVAVQHRCLEAVANVSAAGFCILVRDLCQGLGLLDADKRAGHFPGAVMQHRCPPCCLEAESGCTGRGALRHSWQLLCLSACVALPSFTWCGGDHVPGAATQHRCLLCCSARQLSSQSGNCDGRYVALASLATDRLMPSTSPQLSADASCWNLPCWL